MKSGFEVVLREACLPVDPIQDAFTRAFKRVPLEPDARAMARNVRIKQLATDATSMVSGDQ
jgi:hypothetical protein